MAGRDEARHADEPDGDADEGDGAREEVTEGVELAAQRRRLSRARGVGEIALDLADR